MPFQSSMLIPCHVPSSAFMAKGGASFVPITTVCFAPSSSSARAEVVPVSTTARPASREIAHHRRHERRIRILRPA